MINTISNNEDIDYINEIIHILSLNNKKQNEVQLVKVGENGKNILTLACELGN